MKKEINVTVYRWAGSWGPFKVNIPCGECTLTLDILKDTIEKDLNGVPVKLEIKDWLSEWWSPLMRGGFHAPIVMVENKVISQGGALNRGLLTEKVIQEYIKVSKVNGNVVFGKDSCPHCKSAKEQLEKEQISYDYQDVVTNPRALYEMIPRVKEKIGLKTPVTVPQIWMDGEYIGGASDLKSLLDKN